MNESQIASFWDSHPCGQEFVGGAARYRADYEKFFDEYDRYRYRTEGHILRCFDSFALRDKQLLEIGLGQGADAEQLIRRGARWSGLDLTAESIARLRTRLELRQLPAVDLKQGSALDIPYPDNRFDIVFSHGVLHHVPDIRRAQQQIWRVLKPDGELIVMLYARYSLNYLLAIAVVRRLALMALYGLKLDPGGLASQHLANARSAGLWNYLRMENFLHRNTDGPGNPYSKVYDLRTVREDFPNFEVVRSYKRFMHAPPLPVSWLPLSRVLGWHLWVHLRPIGK